MIRLQAAIITDVPVQILASVFGAIDELDGVYISRKAFASEEMLKTLIGTVEGRVERVGGQIFGACIIPVGTKPPKDKKQYQPLSLLKPQNTGVPGSPSAPKIFELRPHYQKFYAAEVESISDPETVIVAPNTWYKDGLKEKDVFGYYDAVGDLIIKQFVTYGLDGMTMLKPNDEIVVKRHAEIDVIGMRVGDRESFDQLNNGRTIEFHFAIDDNSRLAWVDLDPKPDFPWDDVKSIAAEIAGLMDQLPETLQTEIRFSGRNGFHVVCVMQDNMLTHDVHEEMAKLVDQFIADKKDDRLTSQATNDPNAMRLDYSTLHKAGGLRAAWSLAYPTGLVCVPLTPRQIPNFEKDQATIANVLKSVDRISTTAATMDEIHTNLRHLWAYWWTARTVPFAVAQILDKSILPSFSSPEEVATEITNILNAEGMEKNTMAPDQVTSEMALIKNIAAVSPTIVNAIRAWWQGPPSKEAAQMILDFRANIGDDQLFKRYVESIINIENKPQDLESSLLEKRLMGLDYIVTKSSAGIPISAEELEPYWEMW